MKIDAIKDEREYWRALKAIESLMEGDRIEVVVNLVEA